MSTERLDIAAIKRQFPLLQRELNGAPLVYLDSANTSQKPQVVIDAMTTFMEHSYAPINRSAYQLAAEATDAFEGARSKVRRFINARRDHEVVFTKNATESLNLVAYSWGRANLGEGDVVVLTQMEHHANIVPWHMLVAERGIQLRWIPLTSDGQLDLSNLDSLLQGVKAFSFTSMSKTSISAYILNNNPLPSITGFDAAGPMLPKPSTAVPLLITATKFPLEVYL